MNTFTIEEIDQALQARANDPYHFNYSLKELQQSANYSIVTDYLTGNSNTLQGIQHSYLLNVFNGLISLLEPIENATAKQQLLINLLTDANFIPYTHIPFQNRLVDSLYLQPSADRLAATQQCLKKTGYTENEIFSILATITFRYEEKDIAFSSSPVKEYLSNHIRKTKQIPIPSQPYLGHHYAHTSSWNSCYFLLLEEVNPAFLPEYIEHGFMELSENLVRFLTQYKKGLYLSVVEKLIQSIPSNELVRLDQKIMASMAFYKELPGQFTESIKAASFEYLSLYLSGGGSRWEQSYPLFKTSQQYIHNEYFPISAIAAHYLLKLKHENVNALIDKWFQGESTIDYRIFIILHLHLGERCYKYIEKAVRNNAKTEILSSYKELFNFVKEKFPPHLYTPLLWEIGLNKSNAVKTYVAEIIATKDPEAETKAIALLDHKKGEARLFGAKVLNLLSSDTSKQAIFSVLHKEQNDAARDLLLESIATSLPIEADDVFIKQVVDGATQRGKLQKPIEDFLDESNLPDLYLKDGSTATAQTVRFLLYRMSRLSKMRSDIEGNYIIQTIDKETSTPFALQLLQLYKEKNFKPEHKYLLAAAALLGKDQVTDRLRIITNTWIEEGRYKMAEHGVGALALQGSDKALRWVEWYSRKYRSKKANVGAAALVALENAADELGITTHELGDRIVPDFGFDGLYKNFEVDGDEYRAFIDSNFRIAFFNDDNKKLKAIPAAADTALKEEFKAIAKEVRDIVKSQSPRLEYYLIIQRKWSYKLWQQFFLQNPVMFIYATKLLWGVFDANEQLQQSFLCLEDTSLVNSENDEITIDEDALIGIVHPTQLSDLALQQWKQQFFDLKIDPVFAQLDRRQADLSSLDLTRKIIKTYEGRHMKTGSIRSTLERYGWHKGPVMDGGMLESMRLLYFEKKLEAVLEVEGVGAGYGWGMDEKLGRLYVIDKTKLTNKWGIYPQNEEDEKLVAFNQLPLIFLSEMLAAIDAIQEVKKEE